MIRNHLSYGLSRLAAVARQTEWAAGERVGLTPTQGDILRLLAQRPSGLRLSAIAAQVSVTQPTASDAVSSLHNKGLIDKHADADDGRAIAVRLTTAAVASLGEMTQGFEAMVDTLSAEDQAALLGIVSRSILALQRKGKIAPQRMCQTCRYFVHDAHPNEAKPHHCQFVDAPLGRSELRIDCTEHEALTTT